MPLIGVTLADDGIARRLETHPESVGCVEIAARGVFARPSPYLAWLGARISLVLRTATLRAGPCGAPEPALASATAQLATAGRARYVVQPLAFGACDGILLPRPLPVPPTRASTESLAPHLAAIARDSRVPVLIEPVPSPLTGDGGCWHPAFLKTLCETGQCRVLVDATALLTVARECGWAPSAWIEAMPTHLIGALRISATASGVPDESWDIGAALVARADPEVVLFDGSARSDTFDTTIAGLERLRALTGHTSDPDLPTTAKSAAVATVWPDPVQQPSASHADQSQLMAAAVGEDPTIGPEVALFVLDDAGVFFEGERRPLTLFNTSATLIWCLLDEGLASSAVVDRYRDATNLSREESERHVGTMLRQWFGRGYITSPGALRGDPVPLTTVLAMLITNRRLRASFTRSPSAVADVFGLSPEDTAWFATLSPESIERQGRFDSSGLWPIAQTPSSQFTLDTNVADPASVGCYRLLTTTIAVRSVSHEWRNALRAGLGHLASDCGKAECVFDLRSSGDRDWQLLEGDSVLADGQHAGSVVPVLKQLLRERAVERHQYMLSVHAGVVAFGSRGILLPGAAGSGKTTLTAGLLRAGATYFSDEIAVIEAPAMQVRPLPLALTIKQGSVSPLRDLYPEIETLPVHTREDHVQVRYLAPPVWSQAVPEARCVPRWIVFPRYASDRATELRPLNRPAALGRLLQDSSVHPDALTRRNVEALVRWMRGVDCYELTFRALDEAVTLIRRIAEA